MARVRVPIRIVDGQNRVPAMARDGRVAEETDHS